MKKQLQQDFLQLTVKEMVTSPVLRGGYTGCLDN
jgi:hypothetical protein